MSESSRAPEVRTVFLVRAQLQGLSRMSGFIGTLEEAGKPLVAHFDYLVQDGRVGLFLCGKPEEAALALRAAGVSAETETAVVVRAPDRPGLIRHILQTLEAENIGVVFAWSAVSNGEMLAILRTDSNPAAEDILRAFLDLSAPVPSPTRDASRDQSARGLS